MKFIHISDIHLGAKPEAGRLLGSRRTKEILSSLEMIIQKCKEEEIDLLLIAGDLFHRQPLLRELKEVDYLFGTIPDTYVVLMAGNHDYLKKDSYYRNFRWSSNVFMFLEEEISCVEFPKIKTAVYGLSYENREIKEAKYDSIKAENRQQYEILLAHGGDEKHIPITKRSLEQSGFDYIALGHIHKPQVVCENLAYYAGALEPIDKNDVGPHGYIRGNIGSGGCRVKFLSSASREYVHMDVTVTPEMTGYAVAEKVRQKMQERGAKNIYKITLTGFRNPEILFDGDSILSCGNIVEYTDTTKPAYDFFKLREQNKDNILGTFIDELKEYDEESDEYLALCMGVHAIMESRRG